MNCIIYLSLFIDVLEKVLTVLAISPVLKYLGEGLNHIIYFSLFLYILEQVWTVSSMSSWRKASVSWSLTSTSSLEKSVQTSSSSYTISLEWHVLFTTMLLKTLPDKKMNDISIISLLNIGNFQLWFLYKSEIIDRNK